jgi:gamma-glutamylcyclotransferase
MYRKWIICEKGYANIVKSPGDEVWGLVYDLTEADEQKLDGYENVPEYYHKEYHIVTFLGTKDKPVNTLMKDLIYVDVQRKKESEPKTEYIYRMNMAIADAIEEGVPEAYIEKNLRRFIPK